jgi:hypothetical protein
VSLDDVESDKAGTLTEKTPPGGVKQAVAPREGAAKDAKKPEEPRKDDKKPEGAVASKEPPKKPVSPGALGSMEQLAAIAGVEFKPTVLANDKQFARRRYNDSDRTLLVSNRFSSHASVSTLSRNSSRAAILMASSGSVARAQGSAAKVDIALRAMSGTFDDQNRNYAFDEGKEKRDSYGLAAAATLPVDSAVAPLPKKEEKKDDKDKDKDKDAKKDIPAVAPPNEMRAFVLADADVLSDLLMSNFMSNQLLVVDALRWLGGEESFAGEVNSEEDVRIEHTQQKDLVWFYATIFGAPAMVLGLGLAYSARGRKAKGGKRS